MRRSRRKGQCWRVISTSLGVEVGVEDLFLVVGGLGEDAAEGVGDEAAAPELEAAAACGRRGLASLTPLWIDVAVLVADAVDGADEDAVGDGVGALDGLPGVVLALAELGLFAGVPADGGGEEEGFGALERGDAGAFGVPLVPADERADGAGGGVLGQEAEVAGGEVELLVVERVVGDVHLAVDGGDVVLGWSLAWSRMAAVLW